MLPKRHHLLGLQVCTFIGMASICLAEVSPIDAVTLSILIGIIIGNVVSIPTTWNSGITWSEKKLLGVAIALYGLTLNAEMLLDLGVKSVIGIILTILITLGVSKPIGRLLKMDDTLSLSVGIGTAICGSAAILATKDIIKANETQVGIGIAVINFVGTIGIFLLPLLGRDILHLGTIYHGFLIGNSLQAVGQVVAAGFSIDAATGQVATVVKMGRVMMLTPLIFLLLRRFTPSKSEPDSTVRVPKFVWGFMACSVIATAQLLPVDWVILLTYIGKVCLIISMGAIGIKISIGQIRNLGLTALGAAIILFLVQVGVSIGLIMLFESPWAKLLSTFYI